MGYLCGIEKDGHADQHEKTANQSPRRHSGSFQFRQILDKITANITNMFSNQPRQGAESPLSLSAFQKVMENRASPAEKDANTKLLQARYDDDQLYRDSRPLVEVFGVEPYVPFAQDHFSRNIHIIEKTGVFGAARIAPKGTHLHIHFNSNLLPNFLLDIAKEMPNMYISSPTHQLRSKSDFDNCEIQFNLLDLTEVVKDLPDDLERQQERLLSEDVKGHNLFHDNYEKTKKMRYQYFRTMWDAEREFRRNSRDPNVWTMDMECDDWLTSKLIFSKEDAELIYHPKDNQPDPFKPSETEAGWPTDIKSAFLESPYYANRKRAMRYFVWYLELFLQTN